MAKGLRFYERRSWGLSLSHIVETLLLSCTPPVIYLLSLAQTLCLMSHIHPGVFSHTPSVFSHTPQCLFSYTPVSFLIHPVSFLIHPSVFSHTPQCLFSYTLCLVSYTQCLFSYTQCLRHAHGLTLLFSLAHLRFFLCVLH